MRWIAHKGSFFQIELELARHPEGILSFMHANVPNAIDGKFQTSFEQAREAIAAFRTVLVGLKSLGFAWVWVVIHDGDEKLARFERLWGFKEVACENGKRFFKRNTEWAQR